MTGGETEHIWDCADEILCGAICLVLGWGLGTLSHEWFHSAIALSLGYTVSLGGMTLSTGSTFVHGEMTSADTMLVAIAGSLGLVILGTILIYSRSNKMLHMVGVVFLCRAWIDALPLCDMDGAIFAHSACGIIGEAGYLLAWTFVIFEVLISGGAIAHVIKSSPGT